MRCFNFLTSALSLFVLTACELPGKLGDLPDEDTGGETAGASTTTGEKATGDDPQTTGQQTTGQPQTTGTTTMTTGAESTGSGDGCDGLDEPSCLAAPGCAAYRGVAYDFEACQPGDQYLGCGPVDSCDQAFTTVCRDGTDEVYLVPTSCAPAGFSICDNPGLTPCGDDCSALDESACAVESDFCNPIYGLPHVEQDGEVCVDQTQVFLACVLMDGVCPPFVPTLCKIGDPTQKYDIPSGCTLAGFEECDPAGAQPCP